ncbi:uncharacterized protein MELLADRAFT_67695 [Melampsora larici-populina 98AG31]|uniref:Uncharacterized protein n=1 Tax=Melampsora larici-populina (strain 98AG31 / pathotype 3-4-7) TaxID=747676 RepID=F4S496_MELLP|nr:uncharacterized protein MELLADRAFT_67695 [Melampsora larici-populina 98AG31]EGG00488.1 hypothetical protein MELLADRAFT_67695 [Melampsora larici-populina 98AG31]
MSDHKYYYVLVLAIFPITRVIGMRAPLDLKEAHFSLKPDEELADLGEISETSDIIFKQSGIHSKEEQKSIISQSFQTFQESIETFDWDRRVETTKAEEEEDLNLIHHSKSEQVKKFLKTSKDDLKNKVKQHLYPKPGKLKADALIRKKGYIVFEDGENDDYLQNIIAYLYDLRIPEMIIIHGGNANLRLQMTKWVWEKIHEIADCEIPEILLGEQGEEEMSVFDFVEGIGVMKEHKRQALLDSPMDSKTRQNHAKATYEKVAAYISSLDKVLIGLKTTPTDLAEVIDRVGPDKSRQKMFIVWATPGEFHTQDNKLELLASFNFYRNYEASDKVLKSGIKMVMIGNDLYNTQMIGMIDATHAAIMSEKDPRYQTFKGFEGFTELVKHSRPDTFFHLYRGVQEGFQKLQISYGEKMLKYVIEPTRRWLKQLREDPKLVTTLKITRPVSELKVDKLITHAKIVETLTGYENKLIQIPAQSSVNSGSGDKQIDSLDETKKVELYMKRIGEISKSVDDLELEVMPLALRWDSVAKEPYFLEGCTADPHLEFVLNANLRQFSLKELVPVKLERSNPDRPHLIEMTVEKDSNCWIFTKLDSTKFVDMHQDLINWFRKQNKSKLPWTTFKYDKNSSS